LTPVRADLTIGGASKGFSITGEQDMVVRRIGAALGSTALAMAGLVAVAAPSYAEGSSCSTATPMAGNTASTVGPGDSTDYWSYNALTGTYHVVLDSTGPNSKLYVDNENCTSLVCNGAGSGNGETCEFSVTTPQTVKIRVHNFSATTEAYTLSVEWRSQPALGTQCSDGVDNDGDGFADSTDNGCTGPLDTSESDPGACPSAAGVSICLALTPGTEITRVNVYGPDVAESVSVVGSVDLYQFTLPNDTVVNLPCVVLDRVANPCAALGGTFFATVVTLVPVQVPFVDPLIDEPVTSIGLCSATLTATVNNIGVQSLGAVTIC
jgi:hypothetical protein